MNISLFSEAKSLSASDMRKKPMCRRNTVDTIIVSNLYDQEDKDRQQEMEDAAAREGSRQDKHTLKMNRARDRDFKLDIEAATQHAKNQDSRLASSINKVPSFSSVARAVNFFFNVWSTE